jgi:hypothetical protein
MWDSLQSLFASLVAERNEVDNQNQNPDASCLDVHSIPSHCPRLILLRRVRQGTAGIILRVESSQREIYATKEMCNMKLAVLMSP